MGRTVLVIGASRGIGLELVRQYLAAGWTVHATVRSATPPPALVSLPGALRIHRLEVRDSDELEDLIEAIEPGELDVVVHNAGVNSGVTREEIMAINAEAPIRVVEALLDAGRVEQGGVVVIMTSQMGARRGRTGSLGNYGDSKAALNDAFRARAPSWAAQGVTAIVVHPGWVRTDMGGQSAPVAVDESAAGIRRVIVGLTPDDHGKFLTWMGREHPW